MHYKVKDKVEYTGDDNGDDLLNGDIGEVIAIVAGTVEIRFSNGSEYWFDDVASEWLKHAFI